jgi:putative flippase GtrA
MSDPLSQIPPVRRRWELLAYAVVGFIAFLVVGVFYLAVTNVIASIGGPP